MKGDNLFFFKKTSNAIFPFFFGSQAKPLIHFSFFFKLKMCDIVHELI